ncbi:T9SS type A sorting domain-containing protein [Dokdonia sp.]|uniref:T9SS type A sorting domain-containing protein n=1 Tax=Dokdonia sp. TaxID=2024995 RepID=UPI003267E43C
MKPTLLFLLATFFTIQIAHTQIIDIPDVNFKNALINTPCAEFTNGTSGDVDTNDDGEIQVSEAEAVLILRVNDESISNLTGISYFTNLERLYCKDNQLTTLDISNNNLLTYLYCSDNQLTSLDVSNNISLERLFCENNQLTTLDISNNNLLTYLYCPDNQLTSLDVSNSTGLRWFDCSNNLLTTLDLTWCEELVLFDCSANTTLTNLIIRNYLDNTFSDIPPFFFGYEEHINFYDNPNLESICVDESEVAYIQNLLNSYSNMDANITTDCNLNYVIPFQDINFKSALINTNCVDIDNDGTFDADADTNDDGEISLGEAGAITHLNVESQNIASLYEIIYFTSLESLTCSDNQLTALNISHISNLEILLCDQNQIHSLDLSENTNLKTLSCHDNLLTDLNISANTNLELLSCGANQLSSIDISDNVNLVEFSCDANQLTSLNIENNTNLETISCGDNLLSDLDVRQHTALRTLFCENNDLSSLNLYNNINLEAFKCSGNAFVSLDLRNNSQLNELYCNSNLQLINLILSNGQSFENCPDCMLELANNPNLEFICVDEEEIGYVQSLVDSYPNTNPNLNTDCSAAPIIYFEDENFKYELVNSWTVRFFNNGIWGDADTNDDGEISIPEAEAVISLNVFGDDLSSLAGIEYFENLTHLYCQDNQFTTLDLNHNVNLKHLQCGNESLSTLYIENCTKLETIYCVNAGLTGNQNLSNFQYLEYVNFSNNALTSLNVNNCPVLETLYCNNNQLTSLNVNNSSNLRTFYCRNNLLTTLDVNDNINLRAFGCRYNRLTSIDVSHSPNLVYLYCDGNAPLTSLFIKNGYNYVSCPADNNNCDVTFSNNPNLEFICAEDDMHTYFQNKLDTYQITGATISSTCTLSTNDFIANSFTMYPNPVENILNIVGNDAIKAVSIYDISGRQLQTISFTGNKTEISIDTEGLVNGTYLIKVKTEQGEGVKKIIKK